MVNPILRHFKIHMKQQQLSIGQLVNRSSLHYLNLNSSLRIITNQSLIAHAVQKVETVWISTPKNTCWKKLSRSGKYAWARITFSPHDYPSHTSSKKHHWKFGSAKENHICTDYQRALYSGFINTNDIHLDPSMQPNQPCQSNRRNKIKIAKNMQL